MASSRYHHGDLREALIDAAYQQVEARGGDQFKLSSASRAVGVTHAAVYKHFEDRAALLAAVGDRVMAQFGDALQAAYDAHDTPAEQYAASGRAVVAFACARPHLYAMAFGSSRSDDLESVAAPPPDSALGRFLVMIEAWQEAGWVAPGDPSQWALVLWAAMHGLAMLVASGRLEVRPDQAAQLAEQLLGHIHNGIG